MLFMLLHRPCTHGMIMYPLDLLLVIGIVAAAIAIVGLGLLKVFMPHPTQRIFALC